MSSYASIRNTFLSIPELLVTYNYKSITMAVQIDPQQMFRKLKLHFSAFQGDFITPESAKDLLIKASQMLSATNFEWILLHDSRTGIGILIPRLLIIVLYSPISIVNHVDSINRVHVFQRYNNSASAKAQYRFCLPSPSTVDGNISCIYSYM